MRACGLPLLIASLSLTACRDRASALGDHAGVPGSTASSAVATGLSRWGDCPWSDTSTYHADPVELVREWTRRDARGGMLSSDSWPLSAVTCEEVGTSDEVWVVTSYEVVPLEKTADTARVLVRYQRLARPGYDESGAIRHLTFEPGEENDSVVVIRTRHGWRIDWGVGGAKVLPEAALRVFGERLPPADRDRLTALARTVPQN